MRHPLRQSIRPNWAEKHGTFINVDGRIQKIQPLVMAPFRVEADLDWLQRALVELGEQDSVLSAEGVFRQAFPELTYGDVGTAGVAT